MVNDFFDKYEESVAGVPPENIWNYDKTNLTNDPGKISIYLSIYIYLFVCLQIYQYISSLSINLLHLGTYLSF